MNQKSASRRILITGVNGFSGRHLAAFLAREPGVATLGTGRREHTSVPLADYLPCDLTDRDAVRTLIAWATPDIVYHFAGSWGAASARELETVNVGGFERLRDALRLHARCRRVRMLVVGSAAEIGRVAPEELPVDESVPCNPITAYGKSKHEVVRTALGEPPGSGLEIVVARPFNLMGAGLSEHLAPGRFAAAVRAVVRGETDTIHCGWLDGRRDYLDINDAVQAYRLLMEYGPAGTLANVCSGRSIRTGELLEKLLEVAGVTARIEAARNPREGDIVDICGSHALLTSMTGWQPKIDFDESLATLLWETEPSNSL